MDIVRKIITLSLFLLLGRLSCAEPVVCPVNSVNDFIFASPKDVCSVNGGRQFPSATGVLEVLFPYPFGFIRVDCFELSFQLMYGV